VILGGGTSSTVAAWTFTGEGKYVAFVERKYIGGACPNITCLPSKNIIHSAKVASYFRRSREFVITHDGFAIDMAGVREGKRRMVQGLNDIYMENFRNTGPDSSWERAGSHLRDGVLTHPTRVEGLIPLFASRRQCTMLPRQNEPRPFPYEVNNNGNLENRNL
jgi:hypothetical protein